MNNKPDLLDALLASAEQKQSYRLIMADGVVDAEELQKQQELVEELIRKTEETLSQEDFELVAELISELNVLHVINNFQPQN